MRLRREKSMGEYYTGKAHRNEDNVSNLDIKE